jgi:hypothetical protein
MGRSIVIVLGFVLPLLVGAEESADLEVFFGDLHVHTRLSFDAWATNTRTTPDDAYRFAQGEAVPFKGGGTVQITEPLDFMAVTDHAEYLGVLQYTEDPDSPISKHPLAKDFASGDAARAVNGLYRVAMESMIRGAGTMKADPVLYDEAIMRQTWTDLVETANAHYKPGTFTTFAGFEWSSTPSTNMNLHRNVIFRGTEGLPERPYSFLDSDRPEDLWAWMDERREAGATVLAIPHNANMSGGHMYSLLDTDGEPISRAYAEVRARNEPLAEVAQIKGQSMIHPAFAPDDHFADFEIFNFTHSPWGDQSVQPGSYVRPGLGLGLQAEAELGVNPFRIGVIGSSDGHNSYSPVEENGLRRDRDAAAAGRQDRIIQRGSGGVAAVWAKENTREAIFDALARREAYATTGTRIRARFSGGWGISPGDDEDALEGAVPMGGVLPQCPENAEAPAFYLWAAKGPKDANLDRLQIIKGWLDDDGRARDKVFNVIWAGDRSLDEKGELPDIGNTVDTAAATYDSSIGAATLSGVWRDPEFDPDQRAFYYMRVLQIPTPRWTTYEAERDGTPLPENVPATIQERAWTSAIWYSPNEKSE